VRALIVIGGPTASGKSSLALRLAQGLGGVVVNADSMQLYRDLRVLTARPAPEEEAQVPHRLYGVLDAAEISSAGRWLELARSELEAIWHQDRVAVVVGGTGLYLHALLHGIARIPDIPAEVRAATRALCRRLGAPGLHAELARIDPEMAARLRPGDRQRVMRAHEVAVATGRSLALWQREPPARIDLPERRLGLALLPPRPALHARVEARLRAMLAAGALEEVRALAARQLPPDLPVMKAVGVGPLLAHLEGRLEREAAIEAALVQTRQFAKRQLTWLRHRLPELRPVAAVGDDPTHTPDAAAVHGVLLTPVPSPPSVHCTKPSGRAAGRFPDSPER
jgi:tRNA dimethylallyltransferase